MDYKALAVQCTQSCLKQGADAAEAYLEIGRNLSVEIRNGEIEKVEEAATQGVGFRVFVKGRTAFASSNDLKESSLNAAIRRAIDFARITTADENNVLPADLEARDVAGLFDAEISKVPLEKKIQLALQLEKLAMKDPRITKSAGASFGEGEREIILANSNGLSKSYRSSACSLGVAVVAEKGDQKSSGSDYCTRHSFAELKSLAEIAAKACHSALEMLDPKTIKTQRAALIFDPEVAYALLGGILGAIHGERVLQGASFLGKKVGQQIASELMNIYDDGTIPKGPSSKPFDGEGVPTQRRLIVEKGTLRGFLYNTMVAKRAGTKSSGNASRGGFTGLPGIGAHNFHMMPGNAKPAEIIADTKAGLWLKEVTGYGINPVNGQFSGGASGLWIENGKVVFPVKGVTIAGTAEEMFLGIDAVGNDLDLHRALSAPTFRIKQLQIGGE